VIDLAASAALLALIGLGVFVVLRHSRAARWPIGLPALVLVTGIAAATVGNALGDKASIGPDFVILILVAATPEILLHTINWPARLFFATLVAATLAFAGVLLTVTFTTHAPAPALGLSILLVVMELAALALTLVFAYEITDALGRGEPVAPEPDVSGTYRPRVCLQVPAYNEPPDMLRQTLDALSRVDYPELTVQVIVNNTTDPELWRPVEEDCRRLGPRFQFIHLPQWPGFKAGALNEATRRLDRDIEIIGVVDADYIVQPDFLSSCVPFFASPDVAFVQTPQHYQDWLDSPYLRGLFYAYRYFFDVTMVARARVNAIIFGGTMGLVRLAALQEIDGWAEWCITEDAEASLRLLARGWRAVYMNQVFGAGLMPLDFDGLRRQRFRWAFGGVQILRRHISTLVGLRRSRLTPAQRYHYLVGGLSWFADPLGVALAFFLLATSPFLALGHPLLLRQLVGLLVVLPIFMLVAGVLRLGWSIHAACHAPWRDTPLAALVMLALSWTVARACVGALITPRGVFLRTPKVRTPSRLGRAILGTLPESLVSAACTIMAVAVALFGPRALGFAVAILLGWQALAWGSAPAASLLAQGIRLTPARLVFKRSPQTTGVRPSVLGYRRRRVLAATVLVATAVLLTPAIVASPGADSGFAQAIGAALPAVIAKNMPPQLGGPSPSGGSLPSVAIPTRPPVTASPKPTTSTTPPALPSPSPATSASSHPTPPTAPASPTPSHPLPSPTPRPTH
jgi:cellulose synthase/poly-beta-1,6-N-acetylglucosamine synthase-like glycosyltransferase